MSAMCRSRRAWPVCPSALGLELQVDLFSFFLQFGNPLTIERRQHDQFRFTFGGVVSRPLERLQVVDVGEEGGEAVEVALRVGIELVVVALAAAERGPQPDLAQVAHAVGIVLVQVLLRPARPLRARFAAGGCSRGDLLIDMVGSGSRSPASCSMVNWSNGWLSLNDLIT